MKKIALILLSLTICGSAQSKGFLHIALIQKQEWFMVKNAMS